MRWRSIIQDLIIASLVGNASASFMLLPDIEKLNLPEKYGLLFSGMYRRIFERSVERTSYNSLYATKKTKKQQLASGTKGFGAVVGVTTNNPENSSLVVEVDRSKLTRSFYENMLEPSMYKANDNLKRTALAYSYDPHESDKEPCKLRGVVATKDIPKGGDLITIPYELAIDLGPEGYDPTIPALDFLKDFCLILSPNTGATDRMLSQRQSYYQMLPSFDSDDCRGCTNFFSEAALNALQSPYIVRETIQRKQQIQQRFEQDIVVANANNPWLWIDGITPVNVDHLTWAVWVITSRVLTVQTGSATNDSSNVIQYRRLLIPYLDMCNHHRQSNHVLTGRATSGGLLRIIAGSNVCAGTPIEICYGGGNIGNDRFIQDYGFLDTHDEAYKFVAMDLLGKKRQKGGNDSSSLSLLDRDECLNALGATSIDDDTAILQSLLSDPHSDRNVQVAIQYRIGVKNALNKLIGNDKR